MMLRKYVAVLLVPVLILLVAVGVILMARGYRIIPGEQTLSPTGILIAKSDPDGAQVLVDSLLKGATNTNINLAPGVYDVRIEKDGYHPWTRSITVKKELIAEAGGVLFLNNPSLTPLITTGVSNPILSPDGKKIAYIASDSASLTNQKISTLSSSKKQSRIYIFDLTSLYLPFSENPKPYIGTQATLEREWEKEEEALRDLNVRSFPDNFTAIATDSARILSFSPDTTKVLYEATKSAELARVINPPRYDTKSVDEDRELQVGNVYVYDKKDDKNYLLPINLDKTATKHTLQWLGTSQHLVYTKDNSISLVEYDGGNQFVVYSGPFVNTYVFPHPSGKQIVIMINLNPELFPEASLYSLNIR